MNRTPDIMALDKDRVDYKRQLKREVLEVFRRFGYLNEDKDYEVTFRTTSGSIAWINIKGIEIIK